MAGKRNLIISITTRVIVCIALLGLGVAVLVQLVRTKPVPDTVGSDDAVPGVLVMRAQPVPVQRQWDGFGTAQAMDSTDVPARVTTTVTEIPAEIEVGAAVTRGSVLAMLDDTDFARQVEIATGNIDDLDSQIARLEVEQRSWTERTELAAEQVMLARAEFDRVMEALRRKAALQREVDQARTSLIEAVRSEVGAREELDKLAPRRASLVAQRAAQNASLRLARMNVERCTIHSTLDGILQAVDIEAGENVQNGQRIARVVSLERIEVPLRLPASARSTVTPGDKTILRSAAGGDEHTWAATVSRIAPEDDEVTRTTAVYVEVRQDPSGPRLLAPGRFVRGVIVSRDAPPRWVAPRRAVQSGRMFFVEDGRITTRPIQVEFHAEGTFPQLGVTDRQWVVLRDPLPEDAMVVVNPSRTLRPGTTVRPIVSEMAGTGGTGGGIGP